jgi:AraC-like DNA-binding protein
MTAPPPLTYVEFAPGSAVQDLALTYWGFTVRALPWDGFQHVVWPDGCVVISLALLHGEPVATPLVGPRRTPLTVPVQPGMQYWGVRFRPEMGGAFLGRPAPMLRDQSGPAHHWMGAEPLRMLALRVTGALEPFPPLSTGPEVEAAVGLALDRWLFDSADSTVPPEQCVRDAVKAIVATEGAQQMAMIASVVGVSPRHLQRCFKEAVGLSPKEYALVRRARHALKRIALEDDTDGALARVAVETGFADQSHLTRDFQRLMSGAPDQLRMRLAAIEHSALLD